MNKKNKNYPEVMDDVIKSYIFTLKNEIKELKEERKSLQTKVFALQRDLYARESGVTEERERISILEREVKELKGEKND